MDSNVKNMAVILALMFGGILSILFASCWCEIQKARVAMENGYEQTLRPDGQGTLWTKTRPGAPLKGDR